MRSRVVPEGTHSTGEQGSRGGYRRERVVPEGTHSTGEQGARGGYRRERVVPEGTQRSGEQGARGGEGMGPDGELGGWHSTAGSSQRSIIVWATLTDVQGG